MFLVDYLRTDYADLIFVIPSLVLRCEHYALLV